MVSKNFSDALLAQIEPAKEAVDRVFKRIEENRGVEIPEELVKFIHAVNEQSLRYRQEEWAAYEPGTVPRVLSIAATAILRDSKAYEGLEGHRVISLISVLGVIKTLWCIFFPFHEL